MYMITLISGRQVPVARILRVGPSSAAFLAHSSRQRQWLPSVQNFDTNTYEVNGEVWPVSRKLAAISKSKFAYLLGRHVPLTGHVIGCFTGATFRFKARKYCLVTSRSTFGQRPAATKQKEWSSLCDAASHSTWVSDS